MANIMINELCNLQCPYCFANKYVNGDNSTDMSYANFKKAVDWINEKDLRNGAGWPDDRPVPRIGIIGGEPTLHENLEDLLMYAVRERLPGQEILMFTNSLYIEPYIDFIVDNDINLLINLNSPLDIGQEDYDRIIENIKSLRLKGAMFSVGINYYKNDLDTGFALDVIRQFSLKELRVGLTSPNTKEKIEAGSFKYFEEITPVIVKFLEDTAALGCAAHFDCQKIPKCFVRDYTQRLEDVKNKTSVNLFESSVCEPVIDILPDLKVARCFGVSGDNVTRPMQAFFNEEDASGYFATNIDAVAKLTVKESPCGDCYERNTGFCQSGCISFKMENVLKILSPASEMTKI